VRSTGYHPPIEEYLETIYSLSEEGVTVVQSLLVKRLGISAQSISEMIHRLADLGFVGLSGRGIALTEAGRLRAISVVRKHRIGERFLVDIVGLPWHEAHIEAGRWEHVISDAVEKRFVELLGNPTTCPHGSLIPGSGGIAELQTSLTDAKLGSTVHVARVTEQLEMDRDALVYLSKHSLIPGRDARLVDRGPDGTLELEVADEESILNTIAVGPELAKQIFVTAV
jgi:DtxR family Mn-dependent transcriptional regulator